MSGAYHEKECPHRERDPLTKRFFWFGSMLKKKDATRRGYAKELLSVTTKR